MEDKVIKKIVETHNEIRERRMKEFDARIMGADVDDSAVWPWWMVRIEELKAENLRLVATNKKLRSIGAELLIANAEMAETISDMSYD